MVSLGFALFCPRQFILECALLAQPTSRGRFVAALSIEVGNVHYQHAGAWLLALQFRTAGRCSIADVPDPLLMLSMFDVEMLLAMVRQGPQQASANAGIDTCARAFTFGLY